MSETNKSHAEEFSTMRGMWRVVKYPSSVPDSNYMPPPEQTIATFMNYQDCFCFMQGIAAVVTKDKFGLFQPKTMILHDEKNQIKYKMVSDYAYLGAHKL
jgi:hypothetical protein